MLQLLKAFHEVIAFPTKVIAEQVSLLAQLSFLASLS